MLEFMRKVPCIFFHNVLDRRVEGDRFHSRQLTAGELTAALEFIRGHYEPISIETFLDLCFERRRVSALRGSKPPVFISFDDGYRGTFLHGAKVLEEMKVPAVIFVLGRVLVDPEFVPPYLEWFYLIRRAGPWRGIFRGQEYSLPSTGDYQRLWRQWLTMKLDTYGPFLDELSQATGVSRPKRRDLPQDMAYVTPEQLREHSGNEYLRVASHAMSHLPLAWLPPEQQAAELRDSHEILSAAAANYCPVVSYPDGSHDATARQAAAKIYRFGFGVQAGTNWNDPFAYPRQCIAGDIKTVRYHFSRRRRWIVLPAKRVLRIAG